MSYARCQKCRRLVVEDPKEQKNFYDDAICQCVSILPTGKDPVGTWVCGKCKTKNPPHAHWCACKVTH